MKTILLTITIGLLSVALFAQSEVSDVYKTNGNFRIGYHNDTVEYNALEKDSINLLKFNELVEYVNQLRLENEIITSFFVQYTHDRAGDNVAVPRLVIRYNNDETTLIVSNSELTATELTKIGLVKTECESILNE